MIRILTAHGIEVPMEEAGQAIWFDLCDPSLEEEVRIEDLLGRDIPSPAERQALE